MNTNRMIDNVIEQIKEAQLKLGFANEIIRLYFPAESLCRLLQIENCSAREVLSQLEGEQSLKDAALGKLRFSLCGGNRIEVCIPPEGGGLRTSVYSGSSVFVRPHRAFSGKPFPDDRRDPSLFCKV